MSDNDVMQAIEACRENIDAIDEKIVSLLNERAIEALAIRALKPQVQLGLFDPKREEEIFEHVTSFNSGPLYNDDVRAVYAVILKVSKEMRG